MKYYILSFIVSMAMLANSQDGPFKADLKKSSLQWIGKKVTGEHSGNIALKSGEINFQKGKISSGKFEIDMRSITCTDIKDAEYNKKLIGHLNSDDFFSVEKFPAASFNIKEAITKDGKNYTIKGDLSIKGITNPIEFAAVVEKSKDFVTASSLIKINRAKFDIRYGSGSFFEGLGDNLIYDDFELNVKLVVSTK